MDPSFHISSSEMWVPGCIPILAPSNQWLPRKLDPFIIRLQEAGLFEHWAHEPLGAVSRIIESHQEPESEYKDLEVRAIEGIAIASAIGWGLGLVAFLVERSLVMIISIININSFLQFPNTNVRHTSVATTRKTLHPEERKSRLFDRIRHPNHLSSQRTSMASSGFYSR